MSSWWASLRGVGPVEDEVGGGDVLDAKDVGVEGVFPGAKWLGPDAFTAFGHDVAVFEIEPANIYAFVAIITDNNADGADRNFRHRDFLDVDEPGVEEIRAC